MVDNLLNTGIAFVLVVLALFLAVFGVILLIVIQISRNIHEEENILKKRRN